MAFGGLRAVAWLFVLMLLCGPAPSVLGQTSGSFCYTPLNHPSKCFDTLD